jgi:hypothetical protein
MLLKINLKLLTILSIVIIMFSFGFSYSQESVEEPGSFTHCVILCQPSTYFDCVLIYSDGGKRICPLQRPKL